MRVFCLAAVILAIVGTLALAGSAYAEGTVVTERTAESGETQSGKGGEGSETGGSAGTGEGQTGETGGSGEGQTSETASETGAEGKKGESSGTAPGGEEAVQGGSAGSGEEHHEPVPAAEQPAESVPTAGAPGESSQTTPAAPAQTEEISKATHTTMGLEEGSRPPANTDSTMSEAAPVHSDAAGESPAALLALPTSPPTAGGPQAQASATPAVAAAVVRAAITAAQRAGTLSCELTALGGNTSDNCSVGWLGAKRFLASPIGLIRVASSLTAATAGLSGDGGGHGGSSASNAPVSPTPGPPPGGASGAAVGGGAPGGVALSILTLAGLLLLAGPRAMRRLRLSHRPWLTACFVLIPERPG
jgi:hypothetical protein